MEPSTQYRQLLPSLLRRVNYAASGWLAALLVLALVTEARMYLMEVFVLVL